MKVKDLREILNDPRVKQDAEVFFDDGDVGVEVVEGFENRKDGLILTKEKTAAQPVTPEEFRQACVNQDRLTKQANEILTPPTGVQVAQKVQEILTPMSSDFAFYRRLPNETSHEYIQRASDALAGEIKLIQYVYDTLTSFIEGVLLTKEKSDPVLQKIDTIDKLTEILTKIAKIHHEFKDIILELDSKILD